MPTIQLCCSLWATCLCWNKNSRYRYTNTYYSTFNCRRMRQMFSAGMMRAYESARWSGFPSVCKSERGVFVLVGQSDDYHYSHIGHGNWVLRPVAFIFHLLFGIDPALRNIRCYVGLSWDSLGMSSAKALAIFPRAIKLWAYFPARDV